MYVDICIIEWPQVLGTLTPANRLEVNIKLSNEAENERIVLLDAHGEGWCKRMQDWMESIRCV
jgi:tRNA A37 threonylcarbamoyladenosine biosynthesis protein TsaE